jgi:hypothetical protein
MFDLAHDEDALDPWRTVAVVAATLLAAVVVVRAAALAANALGVDATVTLYLAVALPVLVPPMTVLRLWSDARFDHAAYQEACGTRGTGRDLALGVVVAVLGFGGFVALLRGLPEAVVGVLAVVEGVLLGVTATIGAAREYYDEDAHPRYFALLDRLPR